MICHALDSSQQKNQHLLIDVVENLCQQLGFLLYTFANGQVRFHRAQASSEAELERLLGETLIGRITRALVRTGVLVEDPQQPWLDIHSDNEGDSALEQLAVAAVARTVNTTQVLANWLIGREIVEEEQRGKKRADYGRKLLADLSDRLGCEFGRGYSVDNLEAFRQFYLEYPNLISETVSRKSTVTESAGSWQPGTLSPNLSWSHYRELLRVTRPDARSFYEIEAINNAWSVREMSRQIGSLLFDRLAKSRDKKGQMRLARRGQEVTRSIDVLKDPMVLEFLSLPESSRLVESKLEHALIGNVMLFVGSNLQRDNFISTTRPVRTIWNTNRASWPRLPTRSICWNQNCARNLMI